jgi:hypothetical protein
LTNTSGIQAAVFNRLYQEVMKMAKNYESENKTMNNTNKATDKNTQNAQNCGKNTTKNSSKNSSKNKLSNAYDLEENNYSDRY